MAFIRKHLLKISLSAMLLLAGILCILSLWNYAGTAQSSQNVVIRNSWIQPGGNSDSNLSPGNNNPGPNSGVNPSNRQNSREYSRPSSDRSMAAPKVDRAGGMNRSGAGEQNNYVPQMIGYAVLFLILSVSGYYLMAKKKLKISASNEKIVLITLLGVGFFLRLIMASSISSHSFDLNLFKNWATTAANNLSQVYQGRSASDYPPFYIYVLLIVGKLGNLPALSPYYTLLLKLPSILADLASSFLLFKLAKKYLTLELSLLISAFYAFNPAILLNSAVWGQVDSFFTLLILAAIVLLSERRIGLATVFFASAVLMKPQGIIFLPVLFFELIRQKSLKSWLKVLSSGIVTAVVILLPFAWNLGSLWIFKLYASTLGEYPYASVNAFNFFSLLGKNFTSDAASFLGLSYHNWGLAAIVLLTLAAWFLYIKGKSREYAGAAALILIAGVFSFSTRMHERYLFPAVALAILAYIYLRDKRLLLLAAGFSTTSYVNTYYVLLKTLSGTNSITYGPILVITSFLNVVLFVYLLKVLYEIVMGRRDAAGKTGKLKIVAKYE
ncbi:putative integral membrane protein [Desulfosporosinus orientis DSM 765]|uniref:Putative integral membrane protein n=1 Tax=Desulfosporosinus orientis (strain ATCC 19365 / DSM 765 / NCIMB 8382 / VKM B-1628 / Singapore I) TaxID=768706 RepID=G7WIK8_DESOD|nr:glycosyltransferase 87 family protein [Desulfosporosinus orientis]AET69082.1 putative integral membrane protein [Desulfosporosinus orientis DSM 765]